MWSRFTIISPDSPDVVSDRLVSAFTLAKPGWLTGPTTFRGSVEGSEFRVTRNLASLEQTIPIVAIGQLTPSADGTTIKVIVRPQWWVLLIVAGYSSIWLRILWQQFTSPSQTDSIVMPIVFLVTAWWIVLVTCGMEDRIYHRGLARIVAHDCNHPRIK